MSIKLDRQKLKTFFETGDRPTEKEFINFIDSMIIQEEDEIWVDPDDQLKKVGIGTKTPEEKLDIDGNLQLSGSINGKRTGGELSIFSDRAIGGAYVELKSASEVSTNAGGITFVAQGNGTKNGFNFVHHDQTLDKWNLSLRVDGKGDTHAMGTITVRGHIYGDKSYLGPTEKDKDVLLIGNGSSLQLYGKQHPTRRGDLFMIGNQDDNGSGKIHFTQKIGPNNWKERMLIDSDGNVGIGTSTPEHKLDINGNVLIQNGSLQWNNSNGRLTIKQSDNKGAYIEMFDETNAIPNVNSNNGGMSFIARSDDGHNMYRFLHNNSGSWEESLRLNSNGHVGVGTNVPENRLHVHNNGNHTGVGLRLTENGKLNNAGQVLVSNGAGDASWAEPTTITEGLWKDAGNNDIENGNLGNIKVNGEIYGDDQLILASKANIGGGIGIYQNAGISFKSSGSTQNYYKFYQQDSDGTNNRMPLIIDPAGNVGVGAPQPEERLHMKGNLRIDDGSLQWNNSNGNLTIKKSNNTGAYIEMFDTTNAITNADANNGGISFIARGNDNHNMYRFLHNNSGSWEESLRLSSNGDANFGGNVKIENQFPFFVKRFKTGQVSGGPGGDEYIRTYKSTNEYAAAFVVGSQTSSREHILHLFAEKHNYSSGQEWRIKIKIAELYSKAVVAIDVVFVKAGIIDTSDYNL
ncbi:MAG: hypothetical protein ACJA1C_001821 [Crocinitomicaceae bacterium]|jgi:hypothetical protein